MSKPKSFNRENTLNEKIINSVEYNFKNLFAEEKKFSILKKIKNKKITALTIYKTLLSKIGILKKAVKSSQAFWGYASTVLIFDNPKTIFLSKIIFK